MKKKLFISISCVFIIFVSAFVGVKMFLGTSGYKNDYIIEYKKEDVIGKDLSSIIEMYGEYDKSFYNSDGTGIGMVWYLIREEKQTIFGTKPETYMVILLERGVAVEVYEREGNYGG